MICPFKRRLASYWVSTKSKNETWVWVSALDVPINPLAVSHGSALNRKQPISPPFPMLRSSTKWNNQNWTKGLKKYLKKYSLPNCHLGSSFNAAKRNTLTCLAQHFEFGEGWKYSIVEEHCSMWLICFSILHTPTVGRAPECFWTHWLSFVRRRS